MARNIGPVSRPVTSLPPSGYWPDLLYGNYAAPPVQIGFRIADAMGRSFRMCHTSEVVVAGNLLSNLVTEVAIAATKFDITAIGSAVVDADATVVANAWDGGFLGIEDGTAAGGLYPINRNTVGTAGTTDSDIYIEGVLHTALSESSVGFLVNGPFKNLNICNHANPVAEVPVGRAMWASTSARPYIWVQTWGYAMMVTGVITCVAGSDISPAEDVSGAIGIKVAGEVGATCGTCLQAGADTKWALCLLKCYP